MDRDRSSHVLAVRGEPLPPGSPNAQWQYLKDLIQTACNVRVGTIFANARNSLGVTIPVRSRTSTQLVYDFLIAREGRSVHWWEETSGVNVAVTCNCYISPSRHDCDFIRRPILSSRPSSAATSPSVVFIPQYVSRATIPSISSSPVTAQHRPSLSGGVPLSPSLASDPQHTSWLARLEIASTQELTYSSAGQRRDSTISYHLNTDSSFSYNSDYSPTIGPASRLNYNPSSEPPQVLFDAIPATFQAHPRLQEHRVYVKHLSSSTTKEHLGGYFTQAGQVVDVDIHHRRGSRRTSTAVSATISFNSPVEALIAVGTLDGSTLMGRVLNVELYRRRESIRHDRADQGVRVDNTPRHAPTESWSYHVQLDTGVQELVDASRASQAENRDVDRNTTSSGPVIVDGSFRRPR